MVSFLRAFSYPHVNLHAPSLFCIWFDHTNTFCGRSRWPCGLKRSCEAAWLLGLRGSNSSEGMDVGLLCLLCVVPLAVWRRDDHSFRGVVCACVCVCVRVCVWYTNLNNEAAWARFGLLHHKKKIVNFLSITDYCTALRETRCHFIAPINTIFWWI
jgi:hypothetical protein